MRLVFPWSAAREFDRIHQSVIDLQEVLMATKQEVEQKLEGINVALTKVSAESSESVRLIAELKEQVGNSDQVPESIVALIDQVAEKVNAVDALVADAAPEQPADPADPAA